ncbi:hypothetical protein [Embleya sp. NPDC005575]|uniref:hypothetical protein n=1 Tax=Embleya sp. NPDC005575 TaxID=3156892 RepID=UPI00339EB482
MSELVGAVSIQRYEELVAEGRGLVRAAEPLPVGTTAAHLLFARIHGDTSPPRTIVMPPP